MKKTTRPTASILAIVAIIAAVGAIAVVAGMMMVVNNQTAYASKSNHGGRKGPSPNTLPIASRIDPD